MPAPADDAAIAKILGGLEGLERVTSRRMFGGVGLYAGARLFAIASRGVVYVRVDDKLRRDLAREGSISSLRPFRGRMLPGFCSLPDGIIADKRRLRAVARRSITAAETAAQKPTPGRPMPPRPHVPRRLAAIFKRR